MDLVPGAPPVVDIVLTVGALEETVTVEAGATTLNRHDAKIAGTFAERELALLPASGQNPITLLSLQPGLVFTGESDPDRLWLGLNNRLDDREGAVFGVRGNQSGIRLDGVQVGDSESQAPFGTLLPVALDSVQEVHVITRGAAAADPSTGGHTVNLVTRSGTNRWSGGLRTFYRGDELAATPYFNRIDGRERPRLQRNIGGGSLGGPLRRNRAFIFGDYEGRRERSEFLPDPTFSVVVPSDTLREGVLRYRNRQGQIVSLTPDELRAIDPAGIGVNPAMLNLLAIYPRPNAAPPAGDEALNFGRYRFAAPARTVADVGSGRTDVLLTQDGHTGRRLRHRRRPDAVGGVLSVHGACARPAALVISASSTTGSPTSSPMTSSRMISSTTTCVRTSASAAPWRPSVAPRTSQWQSPACGS